MKTHAVTNASLLLFPISTCHVSFQRADVEKFKDSRCILWSCRLLRYCAQLKGSCFETRQIWTKECVKLEIRSFTRRIAIITLTTPVQIAVFTLTTPVQIAVFILTTPVQIAVFTLTTEFWSLSLSRQNYDSSIHSLDTSSDCSIHSHDTISDSSIHSHGRIMTAFTLTTELW